MTVSEIENDWDLVKQITDKGEYAHEAFSRLYEFYSGKVYYAALRILGNTDTAEDAVDETFERLWKNPPKHRTGTVNGWLQRVAHNRSLDYIRRDRFLEPDAELPDGDSNGPSPEKSLEQRVLAEDLEKAFATCTEDQRLSFLLMNSGYSQREAAQIMGCTVGAVKLRTHRAKINLAKWMTDHGYSPSTNAYKLPVLAEKAA